MDDKMRNILSYFVLVFVMYIFLKANGVNDPNFALVTFSTVYLMLTRNEKA